jgi:hypothetical protein
MSDCGRAIDKELRQKQIVEKKQWKGQGKDVEERRED